MSTSDFNLVKSIFGGGNLTPEKEQELYSELLFMVLTRATAVDLNIEAVEVDTVIRILKERLGKDFSASDIRVTAITKLYEHAPFEKYVAKLSKKLTSEHRLQILDALTEVFKSDGTVGVLEADFFNLVANALALTPAQIRGL